MYCIDFHAHAFPDALAATTIPFLEQKGSVKAALNGTVSDLVSSMDDAGIAQSVICSIATRPKQFRSILDWSCSIQSDRIVPFPSFHPYSPQVMDEITEIHGTGFKGIKLHPYYQDFYLDDEKLLPIFAQIAELGLIVVMHCGYDIGFPREPRVDPAKIATLIRRFPRLKFVATHLGSWQQWDEVNELLVGTDVFFDIAFSLQFINKEKARKIILSHPPERVLFGSDSPWAAQKKTINELQSLELGEEREQMILGKNAAALLE